MPAVNARRRRSRGISWTSIVPAGVAGAPTAIVRVMARAARSQTLTLPRTWAVSPPCTWSVRSGQMKSLVTIRLWASSIERPCGLKPSSGGVAGNARTNPVAPSYSTTRPGAAPLPPPMKVTRKPPFFSGAISSVMDAPGGLSERTNVGLRGSPTSKKNT